jgi:GNAT superfamily N-acetyltransferase
MINKLKILSTYLKNKNISELYSLNKIIKLSYINDAQIIINDEYSNFVDFELIGKIRDRYFVLGGVRILKEDLSIKDFPADSFWHIHSSIDDAYQGLGYGKDLYLAAIKYASELGGVVISGPIGISERSPLAISLNEKLKNISQIENKEILLIWDVEEGEYFAQNLSDVNLKNFIKDDTFDDGKYEFTKTDVENMRRYSIGAIYNNKEVAVSICNIFYVNRSARNIPISIPVKMNQEINFDLVKGGQRINPEYINYRKRKKKFIDDMYNDLQKRLDEWKRENPEPQLHNGMWQKYNEDYRVYKINLSKMQEENKNILQQKEIEWDRNNIPPPEYIYYNEYFDREDDVKKIRNMI